MNKFKVDPYYTTLYVTTSVAEYKKYYKKFNDGHANSMMDESPAGLCCDFSNKMLILIQSGGLDTLVHECMHAALNICEAKDIKVFKDQEPIAYMMGKMVGDIYAKMPLIRGQDSHK